VRIHPTSLSKDFFKMQVFGLKVLLKNSEKIKAAGLGNELSTRIDQHVKLLNHTLGKDDRQQFTLHVSELRRLGLLAYFCDEESNLNWLRMKLKVKSIIGN
jgi:hypothetical protein